MRSAIQLVAFSGGCEVTGILCLLDATIAALDKAGETEAAVHADMARQRYILSAAAQAERNFDGITEFE
jgi:hypothetical protein